MDIPDIHTELWSLLLSRISAIPSPTVDTASAMACPPMESVTVLAGDTVTVGMDMVAMATELIAITATTTVVMDTDIGTVTAAGSRGPQIPGG